MVLRESTLAHHRGDDGSTQELGQSPQFVPRLGSDHATPSDNHGTFGSVEQPPGFRDEVGVGQHRPAGAIGMRVAQRHLGAVALHVHRQVHDDGATAAGEHLRKRALQDTRQPLDPRGPPDTLGDGLEHSAVRTIPG